MKNKSVKILLLIAFVSLSFTVLVSCETGQIKGKYKLTAVDDSAKIETMEYFKSHTLTMNSKGGQNRYVWEYYTKKDGVHYKEEGDWAYEKKALVFYRTAKDPLTDKEEWNKKEKTITLTRYSDGNRIVVYTFQKQ
ncbi:MAG: hypothetical protein LBP62_06990 [Clostridiales bacterium]|jgi:hypothetical protein|nr:hypothetical protein [Clostridiales bacterium]